MIEYLNSVDRSLFLFLNSSHSEYLNPFMLLLSGQGIWVPFIGFFFWYSFKYHGAKTSGLFALFLLLALIASDVTSSYILKNLTDRLRPCREVDLKPLIYRFGQKCGGKYGFVSSHAANSFCLVFFSIRFLNLKRYFHFFWIIPALVAYSRIYLGVHYPGDVICGAMIGLFWAWAFSSMLRSYQGARR